MQLKIRTNFLKMCAVAAMIFSAQAAYADVKLRVGPSKINYSSEATFSNQTASAQTFYDKGASIGLTAIDNDSGWYFDGSGTGGESRDPRESVRSLTYTHIALVAGKAYAHENGMSSSIFAGYKIGFTEQTLPQLVGGKVEQYTFDVAGIVMGAGLGIPVPGIGGTLGVNAGVGMMKMDMSSLYTIKQVSSNESIGYSYGMSYSYPFTETLGLTVDVKGNSYNYTFGTNAYGLQSATEQWTAYSVLLTANF